MAHAPYVPLRIFSAYTILEGAIEPNAIAARARALEFPAAAIVDRNGLYGALAFSESCKGLGVQPIVGALLAVARPSARRDNRPVIDWLPLLAQDRQGYENLCALVSSAHLDRPLEDAPHVELDALDGRTDGLIALTGGGEGALARLLEAGQHDTATVCAERLEALFPGRLYVEISRRGDPIEKAAEGALIDLAYARDIPLVATNPAAFETPDLHEAQEAMLCIADGTQLDREDRRRSSPDAWLMPHELIEERFADLPEAFVNTLAVARRCAFAAPARPAILPSVAGGADDESARLRDDARGGLEARLAVLAEVDEETRRLYRARLEHELDVIIEMGFAGYFLIVADFIKWAKEQNIPVGPGRGSGAGSLVSWSLTITDFDPIPLGLLFERFLNLERVTMPDFDIDFCETRRGEVIRYVQGKYGRDQVAQIITFGTMKSRAAIRDVGRVLQMPYGQVDRLCKLVPNNPADPCTLERALQEVDDFAAEYRDRPEVRRLIDLAMKIEGLPRNISTHAAGVVIGDRRLDKLVPLYRDARSEMPVTQFGMKDAEKSGLVKFDFLGLKTLSVMRRATEMLGRRGIAIDLDALGWDDEETYRLLQRGDTVGVFQLESEGMRRTLAAVKPSCFEDIMALVALYRPGPMDNIPRFGARKNGLEPIAYPHPDLEPVLRETHGIFVYQEQVMEAARVLAGYSLGGADKLRHAMGKKIKRDMDAQRETFVSGAVERGTDRAKAEALFDLIAKFAGYGFNKSHAAGYALIAYQTAWLKAHHRAEFYAASMSFDCGDTDKLCIFVDDMRRAGVACLPPCVNASSADFSVERADNAEAPVRYALAALKGVGYKAMSQLVAEREAQGPFVGLDDFAGRVDPRGLNRRQIESIAGAGGFDAIAPERAGVFAAAETIMAVAAAAADARDSGQHGLFGGSEARPVAIRLPASARWSPAERMAHEKEAFGYYFSGHPVDRYRDLADGFGARAQAALTGIGRPTNGGKVAAVMAGLVEQVRWRTSRRGTKFANATVSDSSGQVVVSAFDEQPAADLEAAARSGACALLNVELDWRDGDETPRLTVRRVRSFEDLANSSLMTLTASVADPAALPVLAALLSGAHGGRGQFVIEAELPDGGTARLVVARGLTLDVEMCERVKAVPGVTEARLSASEKPPLALVS